MSRPPRSKVSACVVTKGALRSVEFAETVFGAVRRTPPIWSADGSLRQVELDIGGSTVMFSDSTGPVSRPGLLYVAVADARATHRKALQNGAREITPVQRQFHGADDGGVEDSAGTWWWIATQIEEPDDADLVRRAAAEETSG